jgi:hypothetical protein
MSVCKASETGDPPAGWGVQAKRGQIPRNAAYIEVRRSASGPEGLRPGGTRDEGNAADGRFPTASTVPLLQSLLENLS